MNNVKKGGAALIIIDAQNMILDEKGSAAAFGIWKHARENKTVENVKKAIEKARRADVPIIYIQTFIRPEILPETGLWKDVRNIKEKLSLSEFEHQFKIVEELKPHSEDYVVKKWNCMDAFHNTELDALLKGLKRDTIIFAGVATNFCVETTVRSASDRGYNIIVLSDCVATMNEEIQSFPINVIFPMLGEVTTADKLEITS